MNYAWKPHYDGDTIWFFGLGAPGSMWVGLERVAHGFWRAEFYDERNGERDGPCDGVQTPLCRTADAALMALEVIMALTGYADEAKVCGDARREFRLDADYVEARR